jgi:hypothetical protein
VLKSSTADEISERQEEVSKKLAELRALIKRQ